MGKRDRQMSIRIRSDDPIWQQIEDAARREKKSKKQISLEAIRRGLEKPVPIPLAPKPEASGYTWRMLLLILLMILLGMFGLFLYLAQ